jgi:elongation factor Ts
MDISAAMVKELRDETGLGMMECKKALIETNGDKAAAIKVLRERGMAIAGKKADRVAKDGRVACDIYDGGRTGVMIEVDCETDFVARNSVFQAFMKELVVKAHGAADNGLAEAVKDQVQAKIAEIGENIIVRRNVRFQVQGEGLVAGYIHLGEKVGVLLEVGCTQAATVAKEAFRDAVKDVTLQIAASNPPYSEPGQRAGGRDPGRARNLRQAGGEQAGQHRAEDRGRQAGEVLPAGLPGRAGVREGPGRLHHRDAGRAQQGSLGDTLTVRRFVRYQVGA